MDSRAVADALGTDPKTFRRFLRDKSTSFVPVGSGSRYSFTPEDLPALRSEFAPWQARQTAKTAAKAAPVRTGTRVAPKPTLTAVDRDRLVWEEEERLRGPVVIADIRNPRVRAQVRAAAQAAEDRLTAQLLAKGLHISQMRDRAVV